MEVKDISEAVAEMEQDDTEFYKAIEAYKLNPPKFQCVNIPGWERTCQLNTDPYGKACLIFANEWAYNMEQIILANSHLGFNALTPEQIDECGNKADDIAGGITGFMYGAAICQLKNCWRFGKELNSWHNKQYGKEDAEGTVNPAVVTISV